MKMTTAIDTDKFVSTSLHRKDNEFVTVVAVDPVESIKNESFVTILSVGSEDPLSCTSEEVLVYRLPGERLGFGLKFDGGSNTSEKVTKLMIQSCAPDSPASRTTVSWGHFAPGDEILEIDSVPVTRMTRMECVRALKESNVRLKLRVRKGNRSVCNTGENEKQTRSSVAAPPPVPPRKYPRRGSKNSILCSMPVANLCPPESFNDDQTSVSTLKMRGKFRVSEPQVYTDLIAQETALLSTLESESDDTGSSMSTIVDKHFSTPTTTNSSFSDVHSVTSAEVEPSSPDLVYKSRKYDLDKVLEPFLQLEREFSSCATIEDNDLFQKLVAAATLKERKGDVKVTVDTVSISDTCLMLEPPDSFQDNRLCYQSEEDDFNNNLIRQENLPCMKTVLRLEHIEEPPTPLPRKEIPSQVSLNKFSKKRPPPPPPPVVQTNDKHTRCPTPIREHEHHESSDSDLSVDRLPRLIDFVPKDRNDLIIPSAIHPNQIDPLLDRQRISSISSQKTSVNTHLEYVSPKSSEDKIQQNEVMEQQMSENYGCEKPKEKEFESSFITREERTDNNKFEMVPAELLTHAECIDKNLLTSTVFSPIEPDILRSPDTLSLCQSIKSSSSPVHYAMLPTTEEDLEKMKPLLTLSSSVSLNLPKSPPAYSRMPPDGHEFPQTYQEIDLGAYPLELSSSSTVKSVTYADEFYSKKTAIYTNVLNDAKSLEVKRPKFPETPLKEITDSTGRSRPSLLWRNDERSERSVKDKIAMFSNVIQKSTPPLPRSTKYPENNVHHHLPSQRQHCIPASSKALSRSVVSMNTLGSECYGDKTARLKSKNSYCQPNVESTNPISINRTQSSIDLTLFSSSCSSAYSSCSPDSSLSPMSSPSYTLGSSSTLPRKHNKSHQFVNHLSSPPSTLPDKKHVGLTRATSFAGSTSLHGRSQSLVDVLHLQNRQHSTFDDHRKDSWTTLIEQRRRTMSKLRGLVIPEKSGDEGTALKPIIDLPEIKSKAVLNGGMGSNCPSFHPNRYIPKPRVRSNETTNTNTYADCSWKSVLDSVDAPKYSPAFKRKTLAVYGISSSASSLSSSLNSSREELRDTIVRKSTPKTTIAPAKPPRNCNTQSWHAPAACTSLPDKQPACEGIHKTENKVDYSISRNDTVKLPEDSDNDSAVSSSRSSLCQEYSPPSSPFLNGDVDYENKSNNERKSSDSPSQSSSRTLRRTLSSETNVSLTSSVSTLTSGSQVSSSNNSSNGDVLHEQSKRVLKAESVEAINRKNVLSSAKYSCGQDFKVGSPLIKDVYDEHKFSEGFQSRNWLGYDQFEKNSSQICDNIKVAYLEIQDGEESDYSMKENSSSVDTDEALDKSIDSTDSLCGSYATESKTDAARKENNELIFTVVEQSPFPEIVTKNEDNRSRKSHSEGELEMKTMNGQMKKSVKDIKKTFESGGRVTNNKTKVMQPSNHLRMSSTDSTTSEEGFSAATHQSLNTNLLKEQQFGSITSLASSSSLISQQELQQLIDEANQTLEESAGGGEHDLMVIILHRDSIMSSIGITLAGGADYETKEITVHKVLAGSPAEKDGRIQKSDRILSINGRNMKGVTHREALSILKTPRPEVVLVISRWKTDGLNNTHTPATVENALLDTFKNTSRSIRIPEVTTTNCDTKNCQSSMSNVHNTEGPITTVTLIKEGGGLGFSLEGGKDSPLGDLPLKIKKIFTGGCAAKSGALAAGDELISLNGIEVTSMSRTEAWNMMKRLSDGQVLLNIRRSAVK